MTDNGRAYREEQQKKEIASIKKRQIVLKLSDADVDRLFEKAADAGMFPEELLENFIGDLVGGTYSNGSDERDLAGEWFDRCGFSMMKEYDFCSYLRENELWEEAVETLSEIEDCKTSVEVYSKEIQNGYHVNTYTGEKTLWNECFSSRERWNEDLRNSIRRHGKKIAKLQTSFEDEYWKTYLNHMKDRGKKVTETMENEIQKMLEWEEHRERLQE
ncbi:MAG: hypothetical protein J5988_05225 [Eubacterium sp.]|nr:hypothetical protein [Eubacterium sp.]